MRQYRSFKRYFNSYRGFGSFRDIMFLDSVAVMVQEFLYSNKECDAWMYFRLDGLISLYDFMSLEVSVIFPMFHELGLSAIKDFIRNLQQERPGCNDCEIEYVHDGADMVIYNASDRLIIPLLWTAYIYANTRYIVEKDEEYKDATNMYYQLIFENSYYDKELTKDAYPMKCSKEAIQMLLKHIAKKCNELLKKDEKTKDKRQVENDDKKELLNKNREIESKHKEEKEDMIMELLTDICKKNEDNARDFLGKVRESSDQEIPIIVMQFKHDGKIAKNRSNHSVWIVLHAAKLYESTESNFNTALRKRS